ncbi:MULTISPECIES: DUF4335 domain-containing protein [Pseudanabaena]|jgi:hypothetical protein|uniref:DUF4335 domain-containing protein n=1 Tax=Pseudanabaena TaxID=1152 RepID=UPI00247A705F|nr:MULTISPECIES: DUF4335 domain-containing protein [Pseudanabaena]MEA5489501.1 DUF4335 domain-containing protein [Pseudanabaena sp. CCNP1317]WGS71164.1 DUF4335 domain-containing protein [Pseudanabaena galeata CCNP1313]
MIQRSYSLPSCTLLVDGIITGGDVMSILTSFSCRFSHHTEPIVGGLELLNALVKVVGAYAQALKSNTLVAIPEKQVRLEPEGKHLHLLSVLLNEADAHNPKQLQIKLNTIQLFDLMESLDRLCCDPTTLPDLKLVTQISDYRSQAQLNSQAVSAIAGVVSLAIAATVLYFIPTPKPQPKPAQTVPVETKPLPNGATPPTPVATPTSSPSPESSSPSPEPTSSPETTSSPESSPTPTPN